MQTILLRVISPSSSSSSTSENNNNNKKVTFIPVSPTTTVKEACTQALRIFGLDGDDEEKSDYSLIIESGRTRAIDQKQQQKNANMKNENEDESSIANANLTTISIEGQLSMALEPSWMLLPYILGNWYNNDQNENINHQRKNQKNNDDDENTSNIYQPTSNDLTLGTVSYMQKRVAPWSVVGYLIEKKKHDSSSRNDNNNTNVETFYYTPINRNAVPSMPGCYYGSGSSSSSSPTTTTIDDLPERIQKMTNSMKPSSFSE